MLLLLIMQRDANRLWIFIMRSSFRHQLVEIAGHRDTLLSSPHGDTLHSVSWRWVIIDIRTRSRHFSRLTHKQPRSRGTYALVEVLSFLSRHLYFTNVGIASRSQRYFTYLETLYLSNNRRLECYISLWVHFIEWYMTSVAFLMSIHGRNILHALFKILHIIECHAVIDICLYEWDVKFQSIITYMILFSWFLELIMEFLHTFLF